MNCFSSPGRRAPALVAIAMILALGLGPVRGRASGGADSGGTGVTSCVRRIVLERAPGLAELAEGARAFADVMYPRVGELLADEEAPPPRQFDLVLEPLTSRNTGEAHLVPRRIHLNSTYLTNAVTREERFRQVFVHEMAHLAASRAPSWPWRWLPRREPPAYWVESLADFARFKLLGPGGWSCAECNALQPHFTSGYRCGGAFLLYLDARYGTRLVQDLARELRRGTYRDAFFRERTGEDLEALWAEFRETAAFLPAAREALELRVSLGFDGARPPRRVRARFARWVEERGDEFTREALAGARWEDGADRERNIGELITLYVYLQQPGGPAERFLWDLWRAGRLPGMEGSRTGWASGMPGFEEMASRRWPVSRTIVGRRDGDPAEYHYAVRRDGDEEAWRLERAWRTDSEGRVLEEYPVPPRVDPGPGG